MKISQRYMLVLLLGTSFNSFIPDLYAGKGNTPDEVKNLSKFANNIPKGTQNKKRKDKEPEVPKSENVEISQSSCLKKRKTNKNTENSQSTSLKSTTGSSINIDLKNDEKESQLKIAKSLFLKNEWKNIIDDVSKAVENTLGKEVNNAVLGKLQKSNTYQDYIDALRNLKGKGKDIARISQQLIKDDKADAAFAILCTYVRLRDVRESISSIYEAGAYETLKMILRNYSKLDPITYSESEMGFQFGFKEGRDSLADILAKALRAPTDKYYIIFFEDKYKYFAETLNYTVTRNHTISTKVAESAFKLDQTVDFVAEHLGNYKFGLFIGALKAGDEERYRDLKQKFWADSSLFLKREFKDLFWEALGKASATNNYFKKELENFEEQNPYLVRKAKPQREIQKYEPIAKVQEIPAIQKMNGPQAGLENKPQPQPAKLVPVMQPLNPGQPNAVPLKVILKPEEQEKFIGGMTRIQRRQPELFRALAPLLQNYARDGKGRSLEEYLKNVNTPLAKELLEQTEQARQATEQLPTILNFIKQYQAYVYENSNDSHIVQEERKQQFLNANMEDTRLAALSALQLDATDAKWQFNPFNMKDATSEDLQSIDDIISSFKQGNAEFLKSDLYHAILIVRTFLSHNTEICLELLASGQLYSRKYQAEKSGDIITHPEQDDANLEMRAWNTYHTLIALWNKIREIKTPDFQQFMKDKLMRDYTKAPCIEAQSKSLDNWIVENEALLKGVMVEEEIESTNEFDKPIAVTLSRIINTLVGKLKILDGEYQKLETAFKEAQLLNSKFKNAEESKKKITAENPNEPVREAWSILAKGKIVSTITNMPEDLIEDFYELQKNRFKRIQESYMQAEDQLISSHLEEISGKMIKLVGRKASDGLITYDNIHNLFEVLEYDTKFLLPLVRSNTTDKMEF